MTPIIEVKSVSKKYRLWPERGLRTFFDRRATEEIWALKDVSFDVFSGDILGIIGKNGSGKSTLLRILSRITAPTAGEVVLRGRVTSLLEIGTGFHQDLTGRENIFLNGAILGMGRGEIAAKFSKIVAFSQLAKFIDTPVRYYSSGMYVRLAFAIASHLDPQILILDEVLAVGDAQFQKKCLAKMEELIKKGKTVILVSHNMGTIERLCNRAVFLSAGKAIVGKPVAKVVDLYLTAKTRAGKVVFRNELVRRVSVAQVSDGIEITAQYSGTKPLKIPCFGFVVADHLGNPIFGSNPLVDPKAKAPRFQKKGRVRVLVQQPRLLDGVYRLSIWLGDGEREYFARRDCLTFAVVGMAGKNQLPVASVGPVSPKCTWKFS